MHILCAIPNSIGIILGLRRQYQWQEAVVVSQAGVRALVCLLSVLGVLAYPASYLSGYRLKVDLYVEVGHTPHCLAPVTAQSHPYNTGSAHMCALR
jgi:uncharacterized membrane protein